jgi:N utilization substance protein B
MTRREAREKALQYLYQIDMTKGTPDDVLHERADPFVKKLIIETMKQRETIDRLIAAHAKGWEIGRLSYVDRAIIRMGVCEFLAFDDIPPAVTINEAVELAHRFGAEDSPRFVNGVLSGIAKALKTSSPAEEK